MATKFKSNVGTHPNAAGLEQIAPGSSKIPQSFLNAIGRTVDRATIRSSGESIFAQLAGGTVITPLDQAGTDVGVGYPHPFKVTYAGKPTVGSTVFVRILEGHILGRMNYDEGYWFQERPYLGMLLPYTQRSIGIPGIDTNWDGGWPSTPKPDTSAGDNPNNPGNISTNSTNSGSSTNYTTANGNQTSNPGTGGPVKNGWTQYNGLSGNAGSLGGYINSGNAGNINTYNVKNSSIYHTPIKSGNAGNINTYNVKNSSIYHTPTKSGNAGSIFAP